MKRRAKISDGAAAAAIGLTRSLLHSWLRRGHLKRPIGGWARHDVRELLAFWLLLNCGFDPEPAGALAQGTLGPYLQRGLGYAVSVLLNHIGVGGGQRGEGGTVVLDSLDDVNKLISSRLRSAPAGACFAVLDLAQIGQKADDGYELIGRTWRKPGRPRKEKSA